MSFLSFYFSVSQPGAVTDFSGEWGSVRLTYKIVNDIKKKKNNGNNLLLLFCLQSVV